MRSPRFARKQWLHLDVSKLCRQRLTSEVHYPDERPAPSTAFRRRRPTKFQCWLTVPILDAVQELRRPKYGSEDRGRDRCCQRPPRTDPYLKNYLIRLLR